MRTNIKWASILLLCMGTAATSGALAATVHLEDIVPVPTAINDFEAAPGGLIGNTWSQQGIRATQINGDPPNSIWTQSGLGLGTRSWYPDAGDDGWTRLTLDSGENFGSVSFLGGAGILLPEDGQTLYFELRDAGQLVLSGTRDSSFFGSWFGFAGGDFDEIRLRARNGLVTSMDDCLFPPPGLRCNYFWVDDIKIGADLRVPEPASWALMLSALWALRRGARKQRLARGHAPKRWGAVVACAVVAAAALPSSSAHAANATQFVYSPIACRTFDGALWIFSNGQIGNKHPSQTMRVLCPMIHEAKQDQADRVQVNIVNANRDKRVRCRAFYNHPHANSEPPSHVTGWDNGGGNSAGVETATLTFGGSKFLGGSHMMECELPPKSKEKSFDGISRLGTYKSGVD